jgi:hypothetical protein
MNDPRWAKANPGQQERLARISDPQQLDTLLDCIARGEGIPEFAWKPRPVSTLLDALEAPEAQQIIDELRVETASRGKSLIELLEDVDTRDENEKG